MPALTCRNDVEACRGKSRVFGPADAKVDRHTFPGRRRARLLEHRGGRIDPDGMCAAGSEAACERAGTRAEIDDAFTGDLDTRLLERAKQRGRETCAMRRIVLGRLAEVDRH